MKGGYDAYKKSRRRKRIKGRGIKLTRKSTWKRSRRY